MSELKQPQDVFFALDIGTRSVIGIIGVVAEDELVRIIDVESIEHPKRAMIDGQIEDIAQVSKIAGMVKSRLEERLGYTLTRVNVAAAGRALKTCKSVGELQLDRDAVIDTATINSLETDAITKANEEIAAAQNQQGQFFCVGFSIMKYFLDDYQISTLIGHKGSQSRVEMIVTFLPNEVVESLYSAMNGIDLQVESLTLEPIAAMNAVIPQELRSLNLALVDIGAGTSDIAISNDGSVVAYAMATVAGDEITEALTKKYIVDFQTAEKMKQDLSANTAEIMFSDILGNDYCVPTSEVSTVVAPALDHLCNVICDKILEVNEQAPAAVFLVGGASKIPSICTLVSARLGIDEKKVAVGGNKPLKKTIISDCDIFNPEFVTPIGIVVTAAKSVTTDNLVVSVNGERITLFRRSGVSVMDLLLSSGYRYSQMLGTSGKNLIYTVNGERKIVRGGHPSPAIITLNGQPASLFMPVNGGDNVEITVAVSGDDATAFVRDILEGSYDFPITLGGRSYTVGTRILRGDMPLTKSDAIYQNDTITTVELRNIFDLCDHLALDIDQYDVTVNGASVNGGYTFKTGDKVEYSPLGTKIKLAEPPLEEQDKPLTDITQVEQSLPTDTLTYITQVEQTTPTEAVADIAQVEQTTPTDPTLFSPDDKKPELISVFKHPTQVEQGVLAKPVTDAIQVEQSAVTDKVKPIQLDIQITFNGSRITLPPRAEPYLFFDMLNLVNIDSSKPQSNIVLMHNGVAASFMTPVLDGDVIDIHWDQ